MRISDGSSDVCSSDLLAYAIGVAEPTALYIETFGTGRVDNAKLAGTLRELVDLTPRGIRDHLGLDRAIYARTASYGHFGRTAQDDGGFSWEGSEAHTPELQSIMRIQYSVFCLTT